MRDGEAVFDVPGFIRALDAEREVRGKSWRDVAREAGVSPSTFSRVNRGRRPDVDGLAAMARWGGLSLDRYVLGVPRGVWPDSLTLVMEILSSDPRLSDEAARVLIEMVRVTYKALRVA